MLGHVNDVEIERFLAGFDPQKHEEWLRVPVEQGPRNHSVAEIQSVMLQNLNVKVEPDDRDYWHNARARVYPRDLLDGFAIPANEVESNEEHTVTYSTAVEVHNAEQIVNLGEVNIGTDIEGRRIQYATKNGVQWRLWCCRLRVWKWQQ